MWRADLRLTSDPNRGDGDSRRLYDCDYQYSDICRHERITISRAPESASDMSHPSLPQRVLARVLQSTARRMRRGKRSVSSCCPSSVGVGSALILSLAEAFFGQLFTKGFATSRIPVYVHGHVYGLWPNGLWQDLSQSAASRTPSRSRA